MRSNSSFAEVAIVLFILLICSSNLFATLIVYDDGKTHTIDDYGWNHIEVKDSPAGEPTTLNLISGAEICCIDIYGNSSVNVSGGIVHEWLNGFGDSVISISGGSVDYLMTIRDDCHFTFSGGFLDNLELMDTAQATMTGGEIWSYLQASGNSDVTISGGTVRAGNGGTSSIRAWGSSDITIDGSNFNYSLGCIPDSKGVLACDLKYGGSLNNNFDIGSSASITLVPEPATFLLFGLGALMLRKRQ